MKSIDDLIKPGITSGATGVEILPAVFKAAAIAAARRVRGTALAFVDDKVCRTYQTCRLTRRGSVDVIVLSHRFAPLVAFSTGKASNGFEFADDAELAAAFEGLTSLARAQLDEPIGSKIMAIRELLLPSERKDFDYWRPERVGDLLFNEWD